MLLLLRVRSRQRNETTRWVRRTRCRASGHVKSGSSMSGATFCSSHGSPGLDHITFFLNLEWVIP